ncbi:MAG: VIT family protein [Gammaproteobacteria bacterium]|jgi:VIT1/CCC1 family predicted Fe2+/Mn2+ transporter|nr:VIT family protein [Gammaproteobacteria bacterium]
MPRHQPEQHLTHRTKWLRAAVMGANDGIVSTASLLVGVASSGTGHDNVIIAGVAGLVAGAMSMAAGEYVSVSSQSDIERADLRREAREQREYPEYERDELAGIYRERGLDAGLAAEVADKLMAHDALEAHARDELGITSTAKAHPTLAAVTSGLTFSAGAALPLLLAWGLPLATIPVTVGAASLMFLAVLGALAAYAAGANVVRGAVRVTFWSALAMAITAAIGDLTGRLL